MLETETIGALLEGYARAREKWHRAEFSDDPGVHRREKDEANAAMAAAKTEIERRIEAAGHGAERADPFNPFGSGPVPVEPREAGR